MVKYSCERCGKVFSQKSHYDSHNRRKTPCENNADNIKALVDKAVEEKLQELQNKPEISEKEEVFVNTYITGQQPKRRNANDIQKYFKAECSSWYSNGSGCASVLPSKRRIKNGWYIKNQPFHSNCDIKCAFTLGTSRISSYRHGILRANADRTR